MPDVLIFGDTERSMALRHEVPIAIGDPFAYAEVGGRVHVLTNTLERDRIARALPDATLHDLSDYGMFALLQSGLTRPEAELEACRRFADAIELRDAAVPPDLPVAIADHLRAGGVSLTVDGTLFADRRRVKGGEELAGIRRAQVAAQAAMGAAAALLRGAEVDGDGLVCDGEPLTAERVRAVLRATCAEHGCPAPPDIMVTSLWSGGGHDPGSGPLPAHLPIEIDLWPRDERTGCWADMTRTFVVGEVSDRVAALATLVREALEAPRRLARPGVTGRELYDATCDVVEAAGHPTQRTARGRTLREGFYFSLGHGVGLEVHEAPGLGLAGGQPLVAGDVIAIEPGLEGLPGIGGVRFEDLLLITEDGCETLTDFPYDLAP